MPALPEGEQGGPLAERVRADHRELREAASKLAAERLEPTAELARALGARLRAHVQMEERELFPYLERSLNATALERIGARIEAAAARRPPTA